MNDNIRAPEVRVVSDDGEHHGILPTQQALELARAQDQDLVVIQPKSEPPVAKIIDFGKYKYEKDMEKKQQKAKQKNVEVKGVRLSLRIGDHDMNVRKEKAKQFLDEGNKVKVEIILRGREKRHGDLAKQVIENFVAALNEDVPVKTEQPVTRQGGQLTSIVGKA
jgi:translation initiation factor IF-3